MAQEGTGGEGGFDLLAVLQGGRLEAEALLLVASLRRNAPGFGGRVVLAEPQPGPLWDRDPRARPAAKAALRDLGAEVVPLDSRAFGARYPHGNKIEALRLLDGPFLFLDTDTLVLGDLAALPVAGHPPTASMRREGTWPVADDPYWPGYRATWGALYDRFGLDMEPTLDPRWPEEHWRRHLYFNAGWFLGPDAAAFGDLFLRYALSIRDDPPGPVALQPLDPWLDQVALPLVVHALGGGRPGPGLAGLDGDVTCHWRTLPLLYARESDRAVETLEAVAAEPALKALLGDHEPLRQFVWGGRGARARGLFDRGALPRRERDIRQRLRAEGLWLR